MELISNGDISSRRTLCIIQISELHSSTEVKKKEVFDDLVTKTWGSSLKLPENEEVKNGEKDYDECQNNIEIHRLISET